MSNTTNGGVVLLSGKDVPPIPGQHPNTKYGFGRMKPGDFLFIPELPARVQNAVRAHARRNPGFEFVTKAYVHNGVEGTGVWRLKGKGGQS